MLVVLNVIRCPFCKTSNYAVEYRGVKTKEEKGLEQIVRFDWHTSPNFCYLVNCVLIFSTCWLRFICISSFSAGRTACYRSEN
jgi:hypothetical protein